METSSAVQAACGGFLVPSSIFIDLELAWSEAPALRAELAKRTEEVNALRASIAGMTITASITAARADLWEGASTRAAAQATEAARACLDRPVDRSTLYCASCGLGGLAASVGLVHATAGR